MTQGCELVEGIAWVVWVTPAASIARMQAGFVGPMEEGRGRRRTHHQGQSFSR
jgi:hypothetical protein